MLAGRDFVNDDNDPDDDNGHGTAVASIAAATANNGAGVAGACWNCRIMPIKALGSTGSGYLSDAARGIAWAVEHGADVVNLSFSGTSRLYAMDVALEAAEEAGVVVVAGASRGSRPRASPGAAPARRSVLTDRSSADRWRRSRFGR